MSQSLRLAKHEQSFSISKSVLTQGILKMFLWILWELILFFFTPLQCWLPSHVDINLILLFLLEMLFVHHPLKTIDTTRLLLILSILRVFWPKVSSRHFVWIYRYNLFFTPLQRLTSSKIWHKCHFCYSCYRCSLCTIHWNYRHHFAVVARCALLAPFNGKPMTQLWMNFGWVDFRFDFDFKIGVLYVGKRLATR